MVFIVAAAKVGDEEPRCWRHNNAERTKWNWSVKDGLDDNWIEMDRDLELGRDEETESDADRRGPIFHLFYYPF